ncbi:MAG TPA: hypothetical protein VJZ94_02575 [Candidatus Paceibacterota bacterium]|uniref:Nucleoside 2-deoxyribosyltransferase n=1 Tax=Candidatus Kaiserbacteria bacterium RIFCSPLOWO2_01_FULL_50_24 TaxID=1798507 RepID=A0A1F6EIL4_9BACT|nr:MAG: hypothetical protein A2673_03810 [Candidatus Kaiserbacteria bacterium RIFCSPHIGHO2_01_FULL_50_13]OGG73491.1 MAG: hypothetical protein A3A34_01365 [Candidatus Kaiserbacteria bacterium RIFCSPLOWO2_01_FULL_50_24]OGG80844.1 MAG: hypothetical protein A3H74_02375 [Candidatus Kaiserbacteria bacterium RIFCSPLOWO2_02_FULL_51_13]HXK31595.1 hypothetical protein [Candidatus Paceibacterota bacterium]
MKSIVICGSQRYKNGIYDFANKLSELGAPLVLTPNFFSHDHLLQKDERERLQDRAYRIRVPAMVYAHFDRMRKAEVCFIYNKDGYLGVNTTLEIGYAHGKGMPIYALERECSTKQGGEICREILFTDIITTPEALIKRLV